MGLPRREIPTWRARAVFQGGPDAPPNWLLGIWSGSPLTPREQEVLRVTARLGYRGAAAQLGIAWTTTRNHLTNCRIKLGARTRLEAVLAAIGRGDLTCEDVLG